MTAHYLACSTYPLKPGDICLIHAGAGGVGQLLIQVAKMRGARVFATVSTKEKAALASQAGADEVILYSEQDFEAEVMRLTGGKGVNVVYDSVAKTTFDKSLNCLGLRGMLALFGQSSGPVPPFEVSRLAKELALPHPAGPGAVHGDARATTAACGRRLRLDSGREVEGPDQPDPASQRCPRGAPAARGPQNHGEGAADSLRAYG